MASFLDNNTVQGTGYLADAYARVVIDKNLEGAYTLVLKGIAAFGLHTIVKKISSDLNTLQTKGELPK